MTTDFVKMHGAGNDFIMIDDRALEVPWQDHFRMAAMATRRTGIGCEGIILIQPSARAHFRMRFLNPDGAEVELCGNGARCAAWFAARIGAAGRAMTMETLAGLIDAEVSDNSVKIWMPESCGRRYDLKVDADGRTFEGHAITVGVPHFVVPLDDLAGLEIERFGAALRQHECFAPEGTNVDFVKFSQPNHIHMRTYERGVEAESGACGTGAVASAIVAVERVDFTLPVKVTTSTGFELLVDGDWRTRRCTGLTLTGPVKQVFEGRIDLDTLTIADELK
ncbi:MAG: diaminopimelate epimerase [Kiritimatiellae bacterium]|nr:diaminopimelate epimerase [Kiritimatiellia bacterium]